MFTDMVILIESNQSGFNLESKLVLEYEFVDDVLYNEDTLISVTYNSVVHYLWFEDATLTKTISTKLEAAVKSWQTGILVIMT